MRSFIVCSVVLAAAAPAGAATYHVTTTADAASGSGSGCSLRAAVADANADVPDDSYCPADGTPGNDTIEIPVGTYVLTAGQLVVAPGGGSLAFLGSGSGATVLDGNDTDRVIDSEDPDVVITIKDLTITRSNGDGAVRVVGAVDIERVEIASSHGPDVAALDTGPNDDSGIVLDSSIHDCTGGDIVRSEPHLNVIQSAIYGNTAAVVVDLTNPITGGTIENSTIANNASSDGLSGSMVVVRTAVLVAAVTESTIANNRGVAFGGGGGSGVGPIVVNGSIVAANRDGCGTFMEGGFNLFDRDDCGGGETDVVVSNAMLGPLALRGGLTPVLEPEPGSSAIDHGTCKDYNGDLVATDQRGMSRPQGPACDIGAVEVGPQITGVFPEPAGSNCPAGGVAICTGEDINADRALERSEIEQTDYVCNGENTLVTVTPEPAGSNCPAGGERIDSGLDTNDNGVLDMDEITSTEYVCNGPSGSSGSNGQNGVDGQNGLDGRAGGCAAAGGPPTGGLALLALLAIAGARRRRRA